MAQAAEKKAYHHGDLRSALVKAALDEIGAGKVETLSLRGLAREVGVSPAAPYHHFQDKDAVLAAVAKEGFAGMAAAMDRETGELDPDATPRDRLRVLGRAYIRFAVEHPSHFRVMFSARDEEQPEEELEEAIYGCFDRLTDTVKLVCGEDAPQEELMRVTVTCWSAVHGAATLWIDGPLGKKFGGVDVNTVADAIADQTLSDY